jgi:16S rRNA (adenine1518-N6/adenine1519-N6)-dimethyltransferase
VTYLKFKRKLLGQVFLVDKNIQRKIITASDLKPDEYVLEIGAGNGQITELIANTGCKIFALEIDELLYQKLKEKFKGYKNVIIIKKNVLDFNIKRYFNKFTDKKIKVIGNIPYYITTPIFLHLIKHRDKIKEALLTVQKEFAYRIVSQSGSRSYGAISCYIQYYTEPEILFFIKRKSFYPVPKIDSCFLKLRFKESYPLSINEEKKLFKVIRSAFNQRRKMLRNSLKGIIPFYSINNFLKKFNIPINIRPEELSLEDFINLIKY